MNVNDGTKPCPTCLSAASVSTLKAVADIRTQLAAALARAEEAEVDLANCWNAGRRIEVERDTLRAERAAAIALLRPLEWSVRGVGIDREPSCPWCGRQGQHANDCAGAKVCGWETEGPICPVCEDPIDVCGGCKPKKKRNGKREGKP